MIGEGNSLINQHMGTITEIFGSGKDKGVEFWHAVIRQTYVKEIITKEIETYGIEVSTISVNDQGVVKIEELIDLIKDETTLVSVMMANNEIGAIQPIKKIKQILKKS